MRYVVSGIVRMGEEKKSFKLEIDANSDKHAKEKTYAHFGSKSGLKRVRIEIKEVKKNG